MNTHDDDEFEIDFSVLEKIKNEKTDKKSVQADGFDVIKLDDEEKEFDESDLNFEHLINSSIESFKTSFTEAEVKEIKKAIKEQEDKEIIVYSFEDIENEIQNFDISSLKTSSMKKHAKKPIESNDFDIEDIDRQMNDFAREQSVYNAPANVRKFNNLRSNNDFDIQSQIESFNESISVDNKVKKYEIRRTKQVQTSETISKNKKIEVPKLLDETLTTKAIGSLLENDFKYYWTPHAELRSNERIDDNIRISEKINIQNYLKLFFIVGNKNRNHPYEIPYRNENVHTYKIVASLKGNTIMITTLYRIDKESREEYHDSKNKFKNKH